MLAGLLLAVIGLGIYNSVANRRLVTELTQGKPSAFEELATRQDAYIFLQAEDQATRAKIADRLGYWNDVSAIGVVVKLLPDPDPNVRSNLIGALTAIARRNPSGVAAEMVDAPPTTVAALIEAATADREVALQVLEDSLRSNLDNEAGYLLAKRIGPPSKAVMIAIVRVGHPTGVRLASEVLAGMPLTNQERSLIGADIYAAYSASKDRVYRDEIMPVMAQFAPREALGEFRRDATDDTAPSDLRVAATRALIALGDTKTLDALRGDPDTNVAALMK